VSLPSLQQQQLLLRPSSASSLSRVEDDMEGDDTERHPHGGGVGLADGIHHSSNPRLMQLEHRAAFVHEPLQKIFDAETTASEEKLRRLLKQSAGLHEVVHTRLQHHRAATPQPAGIARSHGGASPTRDRAGGRDGGDGAVRFALGGRGGAFSLTPVPGAKPSVVTFDRGDDVDTSGVKAGARMATRLPPLAPAGTSHRGILRRPSNSAYDANLASAPHAVPQPVGEIASSSGAVFAGGGKRVRLNVAEEEVQQQFAHSSGSVASTAAAVRTRAARKAADKVPTVVSANID
jgi:hypothetical protein